MTGDFFSDLLGAGARPRPPASRSEKGVQLRGRQVDGEFYIRAADVVSLLEANRLLPGIVQKLRGAMQRGRS